MMYQSVEMAALAFQQLDDGNCYRNIRAGATGYLCADLGVSARQCRYTGGSGSVGRLDT